MKLYNFNTTAAVDRCNEFIHLWAQSACSRGVFMENTDYFLETGKGNFDKNDIYYPCNRTVENFAPQCYYYYPEYNSERNNFTLGYNLKHICPMRQYISRQICQILLSRYWQDVSTICIYKSGTINCGL